MEIENWKNWFSLAKDDLSWGHDSFSTGHFPQTCFIAQQVAEKSLKALAYKKGHDFVKGHSVVALAEMLEINGEVLSAARRLDLYYISPRYPDALPDSGDPKHYFDKEMASEALELAEIILKAVQEKLQ